MNKKLLVLRNIVTILILIVTHTISAQSNGDKLFMEGQALQQKQTIVSQNQAIKKFEAAKVVYTTADKKKMCDNQIAICNNNISSLKKVSSKGTKDKKQTAAVQEVKLALSQNRLSFDGDKKGASSISVTAPSIEWSFKFSEGIEGEENFAKATRSSDAKSIDIEVDANPYTIERRQSLVVTYENTADTLLISQSGKEVTLSTNSNLLEFKLKGGNKTVELYTNSDSIISSNNGLTWYVDSKPEWIETSVEVKKEKSVVGKGLSALKGLVASTTKAATAADVKTSTVLIVARPLPKADPAYSSGRRGEVVFVSQDKTYKITVIQQ